MPGYAPERAKGKGAVHKSERKRTVDPLDARLGVCTEAGLTADQPQPVDEPQFGQL